MWEVEEHGNYAVGIWYTIGNGIERYFESHGTYRTPYRIEAQQIADGLNALTGDPTPREWE